MRRGLGAMVGAVVAMLVAGGCGKGTPERARAEKPEQVVVMAHAFMRDGDAEGLWALFSGAAKAEMELVLAGITSMPEAELQREFGVRKADIDGLGGEALMPLIMASPVSRTRAKGQLSATVTRVVPEGDDAATVEYTQGEATCSQRVTREGGFWKMSDAGGKCSVQERPVSPESKDAPPGDGGGREAAPATVVATPVPAAARAAAPALAPAVAVEPAAVKELAPAPAPAAPSPGGGGAKP